MRDFFGHPRGLATLFMTEFWERFSYYGMAALLILFMTAPAAHGGLGFSIPKAGAIFGVYAGLVYLGALPGGWIADRVLGQRNSVLYGGIIIASGHYCLALPTLKTFYLGLGLIVTGTALLKPNVSTMVGQLYGANDVRRDAGFSLFYVGINLGAFVAPIGCSYLGEEINWHYGFGLAGIGMTLGVIQYVLGWKHLRNIGLPPPGNGPAKRKLARSLAAAALAGALCVWLGESAPVRVSAQHIAAWFGVGLAAISLGMFAWLLTASRWTRVERKRLFAVLAFFLASSLFWSLFQQAGSTLNLFAERNTNRSLFGGFPAGWFQSEEPLFIILLAPVFAWLWVKLGDRDPSTPSKFAAGLVFAGLAFGLLVPVAGRTGNSPIWLTGTYLLLTLGELCLSPVGLSVTTKLAPEPVAGLIMGFWFLSTAVGSYAGGIVSSFYTTVSLPRLFGVTAAISVGAGLIMFLAAAPIQRLMEGVK
ncbi:MAG: peptide MFS transporter [Terriglobia bacterium]